MTDEAKPIPGTAPSVPCSPPDPPSADGILPRRLLAAAIVLVLYRDLMPRPPRQHLPLNGYCR